MTGAPVSPVWTADGDSEPPAGPATQSATTADMHASMAMAEKPRTRNVLLRMQEKVERWIAVRERRLAIKIPRAMTFLVIEQPGELDDDELDRELTLVASLRGRLRFDRFEELLGEAQLRGLVLRTEEDA